MRKYDKKKIQGGVEAHVELICAPGSTATLCIKTFLNEKGFIRIKTPTDGNCFYHTLTKFLKLSQNSSLPDSYHKVLRNIVVDKMLEDIGNVSPYFTENDLNIFEQIENLREDGAWNSEAGDIVTQYAAKALNMRIKIYDVKAPVKAKLVKLSRNNITGEEIFRNIPAQPMKIISYSFEPDTYLGITINMLRVSDGHFELLYPEESPVMPPTRRRTVKKSTKELNNKPKVINKSHSITRKKSDANNTKKKVYQTRSKKRLEESSKNKNNINNIIKIEKKFAQLAMTEEAESIFANKNK